MVVLLLGFVFCMFSLYTLTAVRGKGRPGMAHPRLTRRPPLSLSAQAFLGEGDATLFNLSLLTSDVWAIVVGTVLFSSPPYPLYYGALGLIVCGLVLYSREPLSSAGGAHVKLDDADALVDERGSPAEEIVM